VKDPPHTPAGEYVRMQYDTTFEKKKDAVETVVPMLDKDGKWRVSGYFIK
jgi:ribosomal protein S17E